MTDLFDMFDPMPYLKFFEAVKQRKGGPFSGLESVKAPLVVDQYRKFNKVSRSWPNSDLIMLDAAIADQLGAFLRHPVADEVERAGMGSEDLILIQQGRKSIEYQPVRKAG